MVKKINKDRTWFLKKINTIDKLLTILREGREKKKGIYGTLYDKHISQLREYEFKIKQKM